MKARTLTFFFCFIFEEGFDVATAKGGPSLETLPSYYLEELVILQLKQ